MRIFVILLALASTIPAASLAETLGLLIGNETYTKARDVRYGTRNTAAEPRLNAAGMQVISRRDANSDAMQSALIEFDQKAVQAETLLIALAGRFAHTATETYFLPTDSAPQSLATLPQTALPLSSVFAWLAAKPGKAVLVLGSDADTARYGAFINAGIGALNVPQGVTVIQGKPRETSEILRNVLTRPGQPFIAALRRSGQNISGYTPDNLVLFDKAAKAAPSTNDRIANIRDWRAAASENTVDAYETYIEIHPDGEFVQMAEGRIRALTDTPEARAERAEQSLDLNRNARRTIQRNLSLLGFNTRGIDGIFGPGTRAAVSAWQRAQNLPSTGFLTREQVTLLDEGAKRRSAELEAEAEARRQEQLRADLAYWDQTGSVGDEPGLRAYLKRFPDGEYAELANQRLALIEESKLSEANRIDRQLWDEARASDTAQAYEDYLVTSPQGAFREEAQARIVELQRVSQFDEAQRRENALDLSPRTRQVVEARLNGLGLRPGPVDGVFDDDTRRAIRRYQTARKMEPTGYLSDQTIVQLMADSVRQIFR